MALGCLVCEVGMVLWRVSDRTEAVCDIAATTIVCVLGLLVFDGVRTLLWEQEATEGEKLAVLKRACK